MTVLEVAGRLSDVVDELDLAIQRALAEGPRGVVCDLSAALESAQPGAVQRLAAAGRHVRDWSGVPVAVACPEPGVREALSAHPQGGHLIVTASVSSAVSMVLATPASTVERLRLTSHATALRTSCDFVANTLQDWGLTPLVLSANLVLSELVANSLMDATTDIDVSVGWNLRALRLAVRDNAPDLSRLPYTPWDLHRPRLTAVADLSRTFGVLPTADGGRVAWAVLNAARPRPLTRERRASNATGTPDWRMFAKTPGMAGLSFRASSRLATKR